MVRAGAEADTATRRLVLSPPGVTLSGLGALPPVEVAAVGGDEPLLIRAATTTKEEPKLAVRVVRHVGSTEAVLFVPPAFDGVLELTGPGEPRRLRVVHPVPRPLAPPSLHGPVTVETVADAVTLRAGFWCHQTSTARLDLIAGTVLLASVDVDPAGSGPTLFTVRHQPGDAEKLTLRVRAVSRFADYFPAGEDFSWSDPVEVDMRTRRGAAD